MEPRNREGHAVTGMPHINWLTIAAAAVLGALVIAVFALALRRSGGSYQPAHKTSRLRARFAAGAARAGRRALRTPRRLPGAIRRALTRDLPACDRTTLAVIHQMHAEDTGGFLAAPPPVCASPGCWRWAGHDGKCVPWYGSESPPQAPAAAVEQESPQALLPPPALHHDACRWPQRYHHGPPHVPGQPGPGTGTGDQAPGPGGLPEGDTHTLWPPQETAGPGATTSPLAAAAAAIAAVKGMGPADYRAHLEGATAWEDRAPFTDWLSGDTIARGIPAIRADGDMDAPLSIPAEVLHEMDAGV